MGSEDTPPDGVRAADEDPPYSATFSIRMTMPGFDEVEGSMYRLLLTGWLEEHVDVWPEDEGRVLFAHAPIRASSWLDAMTRSRLLAQTALALCPPGSTIVQVQAHDWSVEDPAEGTMFWDPEDPPDPSTVAPT